MHALIEFSFALVGIGSLAILAPCLALAFRLAR